MYKIIKRLDGRFLCLAVIGYDEKMDIEMTVTNTKECGLSFLRDQAIMYYDEDLELNKIEFGEEVEHIGTNRS